MTVLSTNNKDVYSADGNTRNWPITFETSGITSEEVLLYVTNTTGVSTLIATNVSVDLTIPQVVYPTVVSGLPLVTAGNQIVLLRTLIAKQESDYKNQGPLPAETIEAGQDRAIMMIQQVQEQIDRALVNDVGASDPVTFQDLTDAVTAAESSATDAAASAVDAAASALVAGEKASTAEAEAATDDTKYMTPAKVKSEVQKSGAVTIPDANLSQITTASKVSGAALTLLANIPSGAGVIPAANLPAGLKVKCGFLQRDVSTASGTQAVTGVGFQPKALLAIFSIPETNMGGIAITDFSSTGTQRLPNFAASPTNGFFAGMTSSFISFLVSSTVYYEGAVAADADGFTITWTKTGSPTGTGEIQYLAIA